MNILKPREVVQTLNISTKTLRIRVNNGRF